jgi:hypothetical protein
VDATTIEALRAGVKNNLIEPHPLIAVGQKARIQSGAFSGMEGVLVRRKGGVRVVLAVDCVMQGIAVEVDEGEIEAVADTSSGYAFRS